MKLDKKMSYISPGEGESSDVVDDSVETKGRELVNRDST